MFLSTLQETVLVIIALLLNVNGQDTATPSAPYLILQGRVIPKNSQVEFNASSLPEVKLIGVSDSTVVGGSELTLECSVATPDFNASQIDVELIGPGDHVLAAINTSLNLSHTFDPVLASYAGIYMCKATVHIEGLDNPLISQSSNHTLRVSIPSPTITLYSSHPDGANITSTVTLTANVSIDPSNDVFTRESVVFKWEGAREKRDGGGYSIIINVYTVPDTHMVISWYIMPNIVRADEGLYLCKMRNDIDNPNIVTSSAYNNIHLKVIVPQPSLVITVSPPGVIMSSSFTLICNATPYTQLSDLKFMWSGPRIVSEKENHFFHKYSIEEWYTGLESRLTVFHVGKKDEGEYVCTFSGVEENYGETTAHKSVFVNVERSSGVIAGLSGLGIIIAGTLTFFF